MSSTQLTHLETALLLSLLVVVATVLLIETPQCSSITAKIAEYILLSVTAYVAAKPIVQIVTGTLSTTSKTPANSSAVNADASTRTSSARLPSYLESWMEGAYWRPNIQREFRTDV